MKENKTIFNEYPTIKKVLNSNEITLNDYLKILYHIIKKKLILINQLENTTFTVNEKLFINFYLTNKNEFSLPSKKLKFKNDFFSIILFDSYLIDLINEFSGIKEYFSIKEIKKKYEDFLFKLEEKRNELSKVRTNLINKISKQNLQAAKKFIIQTTKYEQEIPYIAELNYKRKLGQTISPDERKKIIELEKTVEEDKEWCEVYLSNFKLKYPEAIEKIKKINKLINDILLKEGEILYYIDEFEVKLQKNNIEPNFISDERQKIITNKILNFLQNIIESNFSIPEINEDNINFVTTLEKIIKEEKKFLSKYISIKKRKSNIIFVPVIEKGKYFKDKNIILAPLYDINGKELVSAIAEFKWEEELHLKENFLLLKRNRGISLEKLKEKFIQFYTFYFINPEKFKKITDNETKHFFES